ncbi:T9SS type A sorting domain-containing protein [Draconibacterium halophilum]|uniref:T9SS type A sorting domain-containing protein n=1 Tax=Draconibacterium halophilum TaxID=2706887 RepID=A0A6C0RHY8_9BACT|nr:T9SS type A sorting domain-containing protein [Draconibacterium halophilum]QIA09265.1 T9SS type A sorting domain-containing protein [Draconibacterium halophilum]
MNSNQSKCKKSLHNSLCKISSNFSFLLLFFLLFSTARSNAQSAILSGGKTVSNTNYSLSYSIGELSVATYKNTDIALTQGQQQGSLIITSINKLAASGIALKAYPNPTSNFVMLTIEGENIGEMEFSLTHVNGSLLLSEKNLLRQQKISMNQYRSGIYFLTVTNRKNNYIHTFKIIKQ